MRESTKISISVVIGAFFLLLALNNVEFHKMKEALRNAAYIYLPVGVALSLVTNVLRSYRWKSVLRPIQNVGILSLFSGVAIGYMVNNLLPARLGEFVRAYILGKNKKISSSSIFATVVIERVFDGFTLLIFLVLISLLFSFPTWIKQLAFVAAVIFGSLGVFLYVLSVKQSLGQQLVERVLQFFPAGFAEKASRLLDSFVSGLAIVYHKKDISIAVLLTVIVWLVEGTTYYVVSLSFGIALPFYVHLLNVAVVNFGILAISSPGAIGTFEYLCTSVLALFSVSKNVALPYAIVLHAVLFLPITVAGLIYLWKENLRFAKIRRMGRLAYSNVDRKSLQELEGRYLK